MRFRYGLIASLMIVVVLLVSKAPAQEMSMPKPGPEMERVKFLIGTWDLKAEYVKSAMMPQGGKAAGWYKAQAGPGGFSVIADFEEDGPLGKEVGHEIFTWDPGKNAYTVVTVGNGFPGAIVGRAHWEGDNLITEADFELGGSKMSNRAVYSPTHGTAVHIEESMRAGDGAFEPIYRADAVRK